MKREESRKAYLRDRYPDILQEAWRKAVKLGAPPSIISKLGTQSRPSLQAAVEMLGEFAQWCRHGTRGHVATETTDLLGINMAKKAEAVRILFLASNPKDTARLRLDKEAREIEEGLKRSAHRDRYEFVQRTAVKVEDLRRCLLEGNPEIVQIAGHGEGEDGIKVEDDQGAAHLVPTEALAGLFQLCAEHVECVIMTSCYSEVQADAIVKHIPYVIGMSDGIGDAAAIEFSVGFYDALGAGKSIEDAFAFGRNAIALRGIPEELVPVLKKKT